MFSSAFSPPLFAFNEGEDKQGGERKESGLESFKKPTVYRRKTLVKTAIWTVEMEKETVQSKRRT